MSLADKVETVLSMLLWIVAAQPDAEAAEEEESRGGSQSAAGQEQAEAATAPPAVEGTRGGEGRGLGRWLGWEDTPAIRNL